MPKACQRADQSDMVFFTVLLQRKNLLRREWAKALSNLRVLFEGKNIKWRDTLGVESEIGHMVVSKDKLKYIKYDAKGIEEQLLDLNSDPYETTHFTDDPEYVSKLAKLRKSFETKWFPGH